MKHILALAALALATSALAQAAEIKLDAPDLDNKAPLMAALKNRQSGRNPSSADLTQKQLSEILWSATGVTRADGKRTAPSARAKYPVTIYAATKDGFYRYDPKTHALIPVATGDHRSKTGRQDYVARAPLTLVYIADLANYDGIKGLSKDDKLRWASIEAGCQMQNVALYCAAEKLSAIVRSAVDQTTFPSLLKLTPKQVFIAAQTIGLLQ